MAKNQNEEMDLEQEEMTVTLTLDDGSEVECVVLTIFEAGDRDYIALLPTEGAEADEGEVYLYRYEEDADGNPSLDNIEDDDEYEVVADAYRFQIHSLPVPENRNHNRYPAVFLPVLQNDE